MQLAQRSVLERAHQEDKSLVSGVIILLISRTRRWIRRSRSAPCAAAGTGEGSASRIWATTRLIATTSDHNDGTPEEKGRAHAPGPLGPDRGAAEWGTACKSSKG